MIKIVTTAQLEQNTITANDCLGIINLPGAYQATHVQLNCKETVLFVIACQKIANTNSFEYMLNVYDIETISFDSNKSLQVNLRILFYENLRNY